jgi:hypothetical protein
MADKEPKPATKAAKSASSKTLATKKGAHKKGVAKPAAGSTPPHVSAGASPASATAMPKASRDHAASIPDAVAPGTPSPAVAARGDEPPVPVFTQAAAYPPDPVIAADTPAEVIPEVGSDERQRMIEETAYYKAERRGFAPGWEAQDWAESEREIDDMLRSQGRL